MIFHYLSYIKLPLAGGKIYRHDSLSFVLYFLSPSYTKTKFLTKKTGKLKYFKFDSELSLQEWYIPFYALIHGREKLTTGLNVSGSQSTRVSRFNILNGQLNKDRELNTALHILCSLDLNVEQNDKLLQIVCWLLENGHSVSIENIYNVSPVLIAAQKGNIQLLRLFALKSGIKEENPELWSSVLKLLSPDKKSYMEKIPKKIQASIEPTKFSGLTYISITFLFQKADLDISKRPPWLSVTIFNRDLEALTSAYVIPYPVAFRLL